jgi:hypothetical protein
MSTAAAEAGPSRFSLSAAYNRRSLPVGKGASGLNTSNHGSSHGHGHHHNHSDSTDDEGFDLNGMDMFTRNSVAIFERLNQEQVRATQDFQLSDIILSAVIFL